jgi:hypothetical protein
VIEVDWGNNLDELYTISMNIQCGEAHMILSDFHKVISSFKTTLSTVDQNSPFIVSIFFIQCVIKTP